MKKILLLLSIMLSAFFVQAQTWDGSESTDWNDPQNWTPASVPLATGNVVIDNAPNVPSLPANITTSSFTMNAGSALNFNGFTLTIDGNMDINGATLTNSNGGTDIAITVNGTGNSQYIRNSVINDNIIFIQTGTGSFYEAYQGGNTYNGNTTFNYNSSAASHICYGALSSFLGNLTVNRTVAASTEIFENGFVALSGNFSYTNTAGGASLINASNSSSGVIGGTINVTVSGPANPAFTMRHIKNSTTGGIISVQNSGAVTMTNDTLFLTALNVNGFTGNGLDDFDQNQITGTVNVTDDPTNTGSYYFRRSVINGNTTIAANGDASLFEAYQGGDTFNGNTTFNFGGAVGHHICYGAQSSFLGNLTISRTVAGQTEIFENGFIALSGNFSYTNAAGGNTYINASNATTGVIGGTVNVTATGTGNPAFTMRHIKNSTTGGTVSAQSSGTVIVTNDTLLLAAFNVNGFTGPGTDDFDQNQITATVNVSDDASNSGSYYFRRSVINGNSTIGAIGGGSFFEAYQGGDTFNGNTIFNFAGTVGHHICYDAASAFLGNVTVTRNEAGATDIFEAGFTALNGNFSYTNTAGGASSINAANASTTLISGTVNVTANGVGNPAFTMRRINNNTTGGTVSVQNSGTVTITNDTLLLTALNVNGYTGSGTDDFDRNVITGTVNISDDVSNTGSIYSRRSIFNGDVIYTVNSLSSFFESYQGSNTYNENVTLARTSTASINFAYDNPAFLYKSLFYNSTGNTIVGSIDTVKFVGSSNAVIEQLNTGPIGIGKLLINKTGSSNVTLNDRLLITNHIKFVNGDIISSNANPLEFINTATHSGESNASHVNGTVKKGGTTAFSFPVGDGTVLKAVSMTAPSASTDYTVQYFNDNPSLAGYDTSAHAGTLLRISGYEYWDIRRPLGTSSVIFTFNYTDPGNNQYITNPANVRIAHWTGSTWEDFGNGGSTGTTSGTVTTGGPVTSFTQSFFTFGSTNLTENPLQDVTIYTYYADADSDGFGDLTNITTSTSQTPPAGYVVNNTDCNDNDNTVYPNAPELCDNKDNDCDGTIDDGVVPPTFYRDFDNDGFGDAANTQQACTAPAGYVTNNTDCDDADNTVYPNAPELCDGKDNDCDGTIDDGVGSTFYRDLDADGFGDAANSQVACTAPAGYVANNTDCNDADNTVYPNAPELCDGKDNDCDGTIDDGTGITFYRDLDGDGFGDAANSQVGCSAPSGYVSNDDDCDDTDNTVFPNAPELCDGKDNDCDGTIDDGAGTTPYYADADQDGFGDPNVSVTGCTIPPGYVADNTDCNDADNTVYPNAPELCDGKDNDCDGTIDDGVGTTFYRDLDADGFGDATNSQVACSAPTGYVTDNTDCDDTDNTVYPNAPELCDGKDNDCDGTIDDGAGTTPYYADADQDGFGDPNVSVTGCTIPPGYVADNTDCNDADNTVYPNAPELCDGKDNDCDGTIDDGVGTTYYRDLDGDGFGDAANSQVACTVPTGYVSDNTDCDDTDNTVYPNAPELCDGKDNNCDGSIDEGVQTVFYADSDADGFGNINDTLHRCFAPPGYVLDNTDCDDTDDTVYPGAPEITDGQDNDCDGLIDEGGLLTFYLDSDNDGFGDIDNSVSAATAPPGYVSDNTDCDDTDNTVYPGAPELCDGKDNDCDGTIDGPVSTPIVIGPTNMCPFVGTAQQVVFTIAPLPGVTGYQWSVPPTVNIVSGQNTNTLTVTILAGFTASANKQIRVTTTSPCGTSPLGIHYLLAQYPSTPGFITGPAEACTFVGTGNEAVYKINKVTAATAYTWTVSAGMTINSHPGGAGINDTIITVLYAPTFTGGTITVRSENNCGSSINVRQFTITNGNTATPGAIQGPGNACLYMPSAAIPAGTEATYIIRAVLNATSYTWAVPAGASISSHPGGTGANDTVIVVSYSSAFAGGNITVAANGSCGSSNTRSLSIQANLKPGAIGAISANETQACPDRQVVYSIVLPSNTNWVQWTVPANAVILNGQGTASITVSYPAANAGSVTATPSNGCGVGKTRSLQVSLPACRPAAGFAKGTVPQPMPQRGSLEVQVFPNPTHSEFNVKLTSASKERVQVRIYDVNGKQYLPGNININELTNFGNSLKAGVYLLEVIQGSQRNITRLVKF